MKTIYDYLQAGLSPTEIANPENKLDELAMDIIAGIGINIPEIAQWINDKTPITSMAMVGQPAVLSVIDTVRPVDVESILSGQFNQTHFLQPLVDSVVSNRTSYSELVAILIDYIFSITEIRSGRINTTSH